MALKFRRGTTAQQSGSLAFGEPFVNTTLGTLLVGGPNGDIVLSAGGTGSTGNFGAISGSGLDITGNANIAGNLTLGGTITIGDAATDNLVVNADLSSSIIPDITNVFDLGSTTKIYRNVYATSISGAIAATNGVVSGSSQVIDILSSLNTFSGSQLTQNSTLATYTGSVNTRLTEIGVVSGSLITSASAAKTTNDSQGVSITNLNSATASLLIETANLESFTSSINTTIKSKLDADGVISGSSQLSGTTITNLTITNLTTVNQTASVLFSSGSNKFGDFSNDTHEFTGSVQISGSLTTIGTATATSFNGTINATNGVVSGSSQVIGILSSLNTFSGSALTRLSALEVETANLETFSGSVLTRLTEIGVVSGSLISSASAAKTTNDSQGVSITNLNSATASLLIETANLESFTSSINTTIKTRLNAETVVSGSSQITLSSTTGYGTVINQNLLTTSNVQHASLGIGMAASGTAGRIDATNDVVAFSSSDIRFKENIKPIENAIDKIRKISGNTYDWKEENKVEHGYEGNDVGVIAQEIEAVLPQLVQTRESGFKAVKYDKLVALLIEGIKEQQLQIEQLRIDLNNCRNNKGL